MDDAAPIFFLEKFLFQLEIDLVMCILTERSLCEKCRKIRTRNNSVFGHFLRTGCAELLPFISFRTLILISRLCPASGGLTISCKILPAFFWWPKNYGYLDLKIHDFIIAFLDYWIFSQSRFRIEEKIHTKTIVDVSKGMFW